MNSSPKRAIDMIAMLLVPGDGVFMNTISSYISGMPTWIAVCLTRISARPGVFHRHAAMHAAEQMIGLKLDVVARAAGIAAAEHAAPLANARRRRRSRSRRTRPWRPTVRCSSSLVGQKHLVDVGLGHDHAEVVSHADSGPGRRST